MNKKVSVFILATFTILAWFIYGCGSQSSNGVSINPVGDTVITSREVTIDKLGRLPTVTFPSGARIEGLEENTLTPGIVIAIVEQKTTAQNTAFLSILKKQGCIYTGLPLL